MIEPNFSIFLDEAGWGDATLTPMGADAGYRQYFTLQKPCGTQALLMDMSRAGYEASLDSYAQIGRWLKAHDIATPDIHYMKLDAGLAVVEHLGTVSFGDALKAGEDQQEIYSRATSILSCIRHNVTQNKLGLGDYKESRVRDRLDQFVEFYMADASDSKPSKALHQEFQDVMARIEGTLPAPLMGFCHADYHLENLIWRPHHKARYGLIDFQDGFWGPLAYDLLNLLEDARVSVPEEIKVSCKNDYCEGMSVAQRESFDAWYIYLSSHFHCRVIGLFIKLYQEREMDEYLQHIPRLQGYIKGHLTHPIMRPLKEFMEMHKVNLDKKITA